MSCLYIPMNFNNAARVRLVCVHTLALGWKWKDAMRAYAQQHQSQVGECCNSLHSKTYLLGSRRITQPFVLTHPSQGGWECCIFLHSPKSASATTVWSWPFHHGGGRVPYLSSLTVLASYMKSAQWCLPGLHLCGVSNYTHHHST